MDLAAGSFRSVCWRRYAIVIMCFHSALQHLFFFSRRDDDDCGMVNDVKATFVKRIGCSSRQ